MEPSIKELGGQIDEAVGALLGTVAGFGDDDLRQPSLLPGWTVERVLAHLVTGADLFTGLLLGRPVVLPPPPDEGRGVATLTAELLASAGRFRDAVAARSPDGWAELIELPVPGKPVPASELLVRRLVEVEVHHVDLGAAYRSHDWPTSFNVLELSDPMRQWRADRLS